MAANSMHVLDLRRAIERREIVPYFQPIVELRTGRLLGFEVLARWLHPELGALLPDQFIQSAENSGLIGPLAECILAQAFVSARGFGEGPPGFPAHLGLSVNISPLQLRDRSLPLQISSAAMREGFPLTQLVIEITESALVGNLEAALAIAEDLQGLGVRLALDDFGTGYSSLHHLHALPFDEIKIDRSFVQSMSSRRESRKIVAAIVGLGHSLGLKTIGEGIENKTHADMLFYLGCEQGQGWLYGRPVPASEVPAIVAAQILASPPGTAFLAADMAFHLEAEPAQRLAQLQAIYDGAPVGLCFLDRNFRYISQNQRLSEMSQVQNGPRLGKTMREATPFVFQQLSPYLDRVLNGESIASLEIRTEKPGAPGGFNTILVSLQPARDEANEVVGISFAAVDITDRKVIEQALNESEDHYRNTVELSPHIPWTADPEGNILSGGPSWEELTGVPIEDALGEGWRNSLHPDDLAPAGKIWAEALRTGRAVDVEYRIGRGDGKWRWMRSRAQARRGQNGEIIRWYGTLEDIDDRKRTEEKLRDAEARLQELLQTDVSRSER
jgi:PAS domain S-box-containing protein